MTLVRMGESNTAMNIIIDESDISLPEPGLNYDLSGRRIANPANLKSAKRNEIYIKNHQLTTN